MFEEKLLGQLTNRGGPPFPVRPRLSGEALDGLEEGADGR
jgi:hypothetical protein